MNNSQQESLHNILLRCKQILISRDLSLNSRKLYLADIRNFLLHLGNIGHTLTISVLKEEKHYTAYLRELQRQAKAPSVIKRASASLKQLGSIVSETYTVEDPTKSIENKHKHAKNNSSEGNEKYIKHFTNYLKSIHLSDLTIKSYKSDITQYLRTIGQRGVGTNMNSLLTPKNIEIYLNNQRSLHNLAPSSIERKIASITRFKDWYQATYPSIVVANNTHKVAHDNREPNSEHESATKHTKYNRFATPSPRPNISSYISFVVLLLLLSGLAFFGYRQLSQDRVLLTQAYPSTPITPNRQLSFQGRLENAGGTPITSATNFVFKLWDDPSAGNQLYTTGTCSITPDSDGVFNTQIGSTCGSAIGSSVFTENANVYLEVTVAAETLTPRQQIATVAYALNAETIQGFPLSSTVSAIRNTVVPMNQWGEILVGEQSPRMRGISGTFQISAPALSITTNTGTNGNITLAPDGTGQVNVNGNTTTTNFFNVSNAQLTTGSLITGTAANNNSGFKLIDLLSGSTPTSKFSVSDAGNITLAGDLTISGGNITSATTFDSSLTATGTLTANGIVNLGEGDAAITLNGTSVDILTTGAGSDITFNAVDQIILTDFTGGGSGCSALETNSSGHVSCGTDDNAGSAWTDGGSYLYVTNGEVLGNSASAGSNKIAGLYLADSSPLVFGTDNDITFSFAGTELGVTQGSNDINFDANTLFVDGSADRVGIGTNAPTAKLTLGGATATIDNDTGNITLDSFGGAVVFGTDDDLLPTLGASVATLGSDSLRWDDLFLSGASLHIGTSVTDEGTLAYNTSTNVYTVGTDSTTQGSIVIAPGGTTALTATGSTLTASGIVNFANGTTYFVDASGNAKFLDLQVADTGNPGLTVGNGSVGFAKIGGSTISDNSGNLTLDSDTDIISTDGLDVTGDASLSAQLVMRSSPSIHLLNGGSFTIQNSPGGDVGLVTRMTLASNGYLGIGTAPSSLLHIAGEVSGAHNYTQEFANDNVGLAPTWYTKRAKGTLTSKTDVADNDSLFLFEGTGYSNGAYKTAARIYAEVDGTVSATSVPGQLVFATTLVGNTGPTVRMTVDNTGKVAIGTAAPTQELDVTGDVRLTGLLYDTFVTAGISLGATNETSLTGFGASSIVGALNELKNSNKSASHNDYLSWANHYKSRGEGTAQDGTNSALDGLFFDTFFDGTKADLSSSTTSGILQYSDPASPHNPEAPYRVGLIGGQLYNTSNADNDGQTYLTSNAVDDIVVYDRTRDSSPEIQVELGIDPNWYNGVTLSVATSSAYLSQTGTLANKNPNMTTTYNGSLIKATGTDSSPKTIFITIKSPTTFDWTNYNGDGATAVSMTPGTVQTLGATGVSITFTPTKYNVGDTFKIASWYIEPESANRGAQQKFPERSYLITDDGGISIINADTQKVWIRFTEGTSFILGGDPTQSWMLNGILYIGTDAGLRKASFVHDRGGRHTTTGFGIQDMIALRNTAIAPVTTNATLTTVTAIVNDVAATVIPNSPGGFITVSGWGYIIGDATANIEETVTLPYTFTVLPDVKVSLAGFQNTTQPVSLANCTGSGAGASIGESIDTSDMTLNTFNVTMGRDTGTFSASDYNCYTWTATGYVVPKQFVVAATGNSTSGGTDIFNETDGSVAHIESDNGVATSVNWETEAAIAGNNLYLARSTTATTRLDKYQGIHGLQTEVTGFATRAGAYFGSWAPTPIGTTGASSGLITSLHATEGTSIVDGKSNTIYVGSTGGASVIHEKDTNSYSYGNTTNNHDGSIESFGSVKYYTKDFVSEELIGDIRGYWPLNNANAASDFEDPSVKVNDLTGTNITAAGDSTSGVRNTATDFDGSTEYMSCTDANCGGTADLDPGTSDFSMGAWIKRSSLTSNFVIASKGSGSEGSYVFYVDATTDSPVLVVRASADVTVTGALPILDTTSWHHVAFSADRDGFATLFLDGEVVAKASISAQSASIDNADAFELGRSRDQATFATGSMDEVFYTANVISDQQMRHIYHTGYRALQSHATTLGGDAADENQRLGYNISGTNVVGVVAPDWNNEYLYVGLNDTSNGGVSKIQLNSDSNMKSYTSGDNDPDGGTLLSDENNTTIGVSYQLELVGTATNGIKSMSPDNNADAVGKRSFYSRTQTLSSSTKFAYFWVSLKKDDVDLDSNVIPYACNSQATTALCTSNSAWVEGTPIQIDTGQPIPEQEYSFAFPTAGSNLTFKIDIARDGSDHKANTYITRYGASWASSVGGADIAERYRSSEAVYPGDILSITDPGNEGEATVALTKTSYDQKTIGVVTTNPGIVMDENLVDLNWNAASRNSPDRPAVALAGRVPVKVSTANGPILIGDPITSSTVPGIGIKATQAGMIVGRALEKFDCTSESAIPSENNPSVCSGKVLTFINVGHYEPIFYLSDAGDFIFTPATSASASAGLIASNRREFRLIRILSDGAQEVVERMGTFGSLVAANIKGQTLEIDTISPLASGSAITMNGPVIIKRSNDGESSAIGAQPTLIVEGEIEAATISARVANLQELQANRITAREIIADKITANSIEGLDARIASLSAGTTKTLTDGELESITDRIKARIANMTNPPSAADIPVTDTQDIEAPLPALAISTESIASDSAVLANIDADFITINQYLAVIGQATITSLDVTSSLHAESLNAKSGNLAIQPLGGIINLANNTLIVDSTGQVAVNGDLTVTGRVIADSAEFNQLTLGSAASASATQSSLGHLLAIYNEQGEAVASIDASGSANLASVTTKLITIAAGSTASSSGSLSSETTSNATAGEAVLISPNTDLTIESEFVSASSLVYLTPTTNTDNKVLFVKSKTTCKPLEPNCKSSFAVAIDSPGSTDISFNWWVIELKE